jgi:hypothetical protein|tara:strand:- start:126 stop:317 length:192 start_codon:yes stop_codon:yes gene_type:complete
MGTKRDYMMKDFGTTPLGSTEASKKYKYGHLSGGYKYDHISGGAASNSKLDKAIRKLDTYTKD